MSDYTFKHTSRIFRDNLTENLLGGTLEFCKWAALNAGGFQNVPLNLSGVYGGDKSRLRLVSDPRYDDGQVWEGFRSDWVWESGITYDTQPVTISGIYIDNVFYSNDESEYYIDYPNGRVIFNSGISTSSVVKSSFSHRTVNFYSSEYLPISDIFFGSYRVEHTDYLTPSSGSWSKLLDRQLPLIALQLNTDKSFEPYEIGGGQWISTGGVFYVLAENNYDKNSLVDLLSLQNEKTFWIPNFGQMKDSGVYPYDFDYLGKLVDNPVQYPDMVTYYKWRKVILENTRVYNQEHLNYKGGRLYGAIVKTTFTVIM